MISVDRTPVVSYHDARTSPPPRDVPVGHFISVPLPTLRWTTPGYAAFACPCTRQPGRPPVVSSPDRWWVQDATTRSLLAYNRATAVPFAELAAGRHTLDCVTRSATQAIEDLAVLDGLLGRLSVDYFAGRPADRVLGGDVLSTIAAVIDPRLLTWHRLLTPDLFAYLED